ncbi:hypothetical protein POF50_010130 [Streptomyces sp. SL13]|uniref:Uncharacterized protein n=1 Tax=Streptantibioticus silvisoli TaxID=2705255 RepID=A0AA90H1Q0_9ACTN|nr:hypothetical protein [Streptantibioticus silvisoli]MDI5969691.1 hypothetical protein [Streptantibioticus silvisoli]
MPTPIGARGGMAFSADEVRVVRRALTEALGPDFRSPAPPAVPAPARGPDETTQAPLLRRLVHDLDEAVGEAARRRAFTAADLARHRAALPGAALGYLDRLAEALDDGCPPAPEDLAAVRGLAAVPCTPAEAFRRAGLRHRCERLGARPPAGRARLLALPGGRTGSSGAPDPGPRPADPAEAEPGRRVPTPAEIWPPRRGTPPDGDRPAD